jgi:hypothetical protein
MTMNGSGRFDSRFLAAVVTALGIITAAWIAAGAARHFVDSRATITVTGSAKQTLRSDRPLARRLQHQSPQLARRMPSSRPRAAPCSPLPRRASPTAR